MWKNKIGGILVSLSILIAATSSSWRLERTDTIPPGGVSLSCSEKVVYVNTAYLQTLYQIYFPSFVHPKVVEEHFLQLIRVNELCQEESHD